jgi:YggT family protein
VHILCQLAQLYLLILLARVVLSWFPISPGSGLSTVFNVLYRLTEPVLGPLRRVLPPVGIGGMGLDLSPIIVFFVLEFVVLRPPIC